MAEHQERNLAHKTITDLRAQYLCNDLDRGVLKPFPCK